MFYFKLLFSLYFFISVTTILKIQLHQSHYLIYYLKYFTGSFGSTLAFIVGDEIDTSGIFFAFVNKAIVNVHLAPGS